MKNLLTGLFRAARKRLMTTDNDMGMFRQKLDELVASKDTLSDEEIVAKVEELKGFTNDLPGDDDKAKLDRFLEDFKAIKEQDEATAKEAARMVADLFEKLDTEAMKDAPGVEAENEDAEPEEKVEEESTEEETVESPLVEGSAPETEAEDEDPNPAYTLEEVYQFCKKRRAEEEAEDAACKDEAAEENQEKEDEESVTTDHAPFIPVTINSAEAKGSLAAMFAEAKRGR